MTPRFLAELLGRWWCQLQGWEPRGRRGGFSGLGQTSSCSANIAHQTSGGVTGSVALTLKGGQITLGQVGELPVRGMFLDGVPWRGTRQ